MKDNIKQDIEHLECMRDKFEEWLTDNGNYSHLKHKHFGGNYIHEESAMKWDGFKEGYKTAIANYTTQWQPIETAPKDGSYIILYRPSNDGRHKDAVREGKFHRYGMAETWRVRSGGVWDIDAPTHWQPLPEPPESEEV